MSSPQLELSELPAIFQSEIDGFLQANRTALLDISADFEFVLQSLQTYLAAGKRLRPAFATAGYLAAGAQPSVEFFRSVTALEFVQASALIHDDLMDLSDSRRGNPTIHKQFEALHRSAGWHGNPAEFGSSSAILLGTLCLVWADQIYFESGFSAEKLLRAKPIYDDLRVEVMAGQYLDVLEQQRRLANPSEIQNIVRHKTAKYTVERPLLLGAELGGADFAQKQALAAYGLAIGEAFQYRDDLLGVLGDEKLTGKPVGDDIREGKRTLLVALVHATASASQWTWFEQRLGNSTLSDDEVIEVGAFLQEMGIVQQIEATISALQATADEELRKASFSPLCLELLDELTAAALVRNK